MLALAHGTLGPSQARAQGAAMVDPPTRVLSAEPGGTVAAAVRVTNPTDRPMRLRLYRSDWDLDSSGQFRFMPPDSSPSSASGWVTVEDTVIELEPQDTDDVEYFVEAPADAAPGTHRTVLFFESEPGEPEPGQLGASVAVRVGHIVYANVPPTESAGAITGIFGERGSGDRDPYRLFVQYANTGNAVHAVSGELSVRDASGRAVIEAPIDRSVVLPGSDRSFDIDLFGPLDPGNYTALVVLDYGDAEQEVAGTYDFALERALSAPDGP
jgi:hypothetical protein